MLAFLIALGVGLVLPPPVLARTDPSRGQYQIRASVVSRACFPAVSPCRNRLEYQGSQAPYLGANLLVKRQLDPRSEAQQTQYHEPQSRSEKRELMLQIGFGLALLYAAFLTVWFWATRRRRIDTRRRIH